MNFFKKRDRKVASVELSAADRAHAAQLALEAESRAICDTKDPKYLAVYAEVVAALIKAREENLGFVSLSSLFEHPQPTLKYLCLVLANLKEEDKVERRIRIRIPEYNVEQTFPSIVDIPLDIQVPDGTFVRILPKHFEQQWRATDKLV